MEDKLENILKNLPEFDPWDSINFGQELFHVSDDGTIRQIPVMSEEGQAVLDKFYDR